ncbi:hypothetical protein E8E14_007503 [Neopestalotiopsis sp. 37M]|nr:hypothetical protein E8E14_007503 [Neopestalotiopsis sp. 37M]
MVGANSQFRTGGGEGGGSNGSLDNHKPAGGGGGKVGFRERIEHFTWANFTGTQSTGGIAILLSDTPHQFPGLQTAGVVVFILNLVLFAVLCAAMLTRFFLHPTTIPVIMFYRRLDVFKMNPAIFLTVFNVMLTGTIAASIAEQQPPGQRLPIIVAGITYQGLGWILSLVYMPWFMGTLWMSGLSSPDQRPGLFMPVGSAGYTIVSLIGCSQALPRNYAYFATHPMGVDVLQIVADWASIFLWLFAFWIFAVALIANLPVAIPYHNGRFAAPRMGFKLSWWAIIFPNVGFTIATGFIGNVLGSAAIQWVCTIMTVLLFAFWLLGLVLHLKAVVTGRIMWPGKDEDATK